MKKLFLLVAVSFFMVSCASSGPYTVKNQMDVEQLKGTVVFPNITILPMLQRVLPLIDAGIYNGGLNKHADSRNAAVAKAATVLRRDLSERFAENFAVKTVLAEKKFDAVLFDKNDNVLPTVEQEIIKQCQDSKADYIILINSQIETYGVAAFGINGTNRFNVGAFIFDKTGKKLSQGRTSTDIVYMKSSESEKFGEMVEMSRARILGLFNNMIIASPAK